MSYQVLARKWRPNTFAELVGQEHVVAAISNALDNDRLHHAYLFTGTRGVGKTTIARIFSKSLNCEQGQSATPCGQCHTCKEIERGNYVDLLEIDAASRTKVEDTRELLDNVQYKPTRGRFKVYLIDEVHMLSKHSFNALLKTLEEPPPHVKFLLATTDPQKLPVTILSRCLQFNLKALSRDQIGAQLANILQQENIEYEDSALALLARAANGSMRDALSLTDQAIAQGNNKVSAAIVTDMLGLMDRHQLLKLLHAVVQKQPDKVMDIVSAIAEQAPDYGQMLAEISSLLHQIALTQWVPDACKLETTSAKAIFKLAQQLPAEQVQLMYQIALQGRKDLPFAVDGRSGTEMTLLRMMSFAPTPALIDTQETIASETPRAKELRVSGDEPIAGADSAEQDNPQEDSPAAGHIPETASSDFYAAHQDEPIEPSTYSEPFDAESEESSYAQAQSDDAPDSAAVPPRASTKEMLELRQRLKRNRKEEAQSQVKKPEVSSRLGNHPADAVKKVSPDYDEPNKPLQPESISAEPYDASANDDSPPPWVTDIPYADDGNNEASDYTGEIHPVHGGSADADISEPVKEDSKSSDAAEAFPAPAERSLVANTREPELSAYLSDGTKLIAASQIDTWSALIEQMPVAGLIKQIALHSAMTQTADQVSLEMAREQQHLLNDSAISQLEEALISAMGQQITLRVEVGEPQETPFSLQQSINEMRLRHARHVVDTDEVIQSLSDVFGASVLSDTIQAR